MASNALPKYTVRELGPHLTVLYEEYLKLTDALASGKIDAVEALSRAGRLKVEDAYGAVWSLDPQTGLFRAVSRNGQSIPHADPSSFRERPDVDIRTLRERITADDRAPRGEMEEDTQMTRREVLYGGGGALTGLLLGAAGGWVLKPAGQVGSAESKPRPTMPENGPGSDRQTQVVRSLTSGDPSRISAVVPSASQDSIARAAELLQVRSGKTKAEVAMEGTVPILRIINSRNVVLLVGDLEWVRRGGSWVLGSMPEWKVLST